MTDALPNFDLNLLIPLHALLTEQNVTKAAERASVGQPAMSASLAKLRRHFNDPLLVRDGRRMTLTPLGASLVEPVDDIITRVSATVSTNAQFEPGAQGRRFTIAASDYVSTVLLRPLLKQIQELDADVQIRVMSLAPGFVDQLRKGTCDLVIWPPALPHEELNGFSCETLFSDEFVAVVDADHPTAGDAITAEEFSALRYVEVAAQSSTLADIEFTGLGMSLRVAASTENFTSAACLLPGTAMTMVMQKRLFQELGMPIGLKTIPLVAPLPPLVEAMYWHPQTSASPAHQWLREQLRRISANL